MIAVGAAVIALAGGLVWGLTRSDDSASGKHTAEQPASTPSPTQCPAGDVQVEAALLFARSNPKATSKALHVLQAVGKRPMGDAQRKRYERTVASVETARETQASKHLALLTKKAQRMRDRGALDEMVVVLQDWPSDLRGTRAHANAERHATQWRQAALAAFEPLRKEVDAALAGWTATLPSAAVVSELAKRVDAANQNLALPAQLREPFTGISSRIATWSSYVSAQANRAAATRALRKVLQGQPNERARALHALATNTEIAETDIARAAGVVMGLTDGLSQWPRWFVDPSHPMACVIDGTLHVGKAPNVVFFDLFAPGFTIWDEAAPWRVDDHDALAHVGAEHVAASRWAYGRPMANMSEAALAPLTALATLAGVPLPTNAAPTPTPFWRALHRRVSLALRDPKQRLPEPGKDATPLLAAWTLATQGVRAKDGPPKARESLASARSAYLDDKMLLAWTHAQAAVDGLPADGEAALLSCLILEKLSLKLPTRPMLWLLLSEARRAWDLDASLAPAAVETAKHALAIYRSADDDALRKRVEPLTFEACRAVQRLRRDDAPIATFIAGYFARHGDAKQALRGARKAYERWPEDEDVLLIFARVEFDHGDKQKALRALRTAQMRMGERLPAWARELRETR